ncbi:MAG TPA: hypothetical protein VKU60_12375, partial [Chloroflexota bacterium]|nr:hypothetical protein [Chloroflexota bacterium]
DAVSMNAPDSQAAARAGLQCLLRFGDVFPISTFALLTTDRELGTHSDRAERMVRGLLQAIDDFIRDFSLGTELLRQQGVPDDLLEGTYWETRGYLRPDGRLPEDVQRLWIEWSKADLWASRKTSRSIACLTSASWNTSWSTVDRLDHQPHWSASRAIAAACCLADSNSSLFRNGTLRSGGAYEV